MTFFLIADLLTKINHRIKIVKELRAYINALKALNKTSKEKDDLEQKLNNISLNGLKLIKSVVISIIFYFIFYFSLQNVSVILSTVIASLPYLMIHFKKICLTISLLDKTLHRQFLSKNNPLSKYFYQDIIKKSDKQDIPNKKHIFITGLARAGTTALLNKIYDSNDIGSLMYKYMPFILAPDLAKIYSNILGNSKQKTERFHNDGLFINSDSPECLDEVYWIMADNQYFDDEIFL